MFNRCWYRDLRLFAIQLLRGLRKICYMIFLQRPGLFFVLVLCVLSVAGFKYIDRHFHVVSFFKTSNSSFVEDNFAALKLDEIQFKDGRKRNLILIFLESMEYGYSDHRDYSQNLIPELKLIADQNIHLSGYKKTQGGYYTLDGVTAQTLGVPLTQMPRGIHIHGKKEEQQKYGVFLGGVNGIFNLLKTYGYQTAAFMGTPGEYTHQGDFLNVHGVDKIFAAETWDERGYPRKGNSGRWAFNDGFVIERVKEYLEEIKHGDQPFALIMETIDTHFPNGWAPNPKDFNKNGTYQDALLYSSKLIATFYDWMREQPWFDDTTIIILGDHPFQDAKGVPFTNLTVKAKNRETYNAFINTVGGEPRVRNCGFSAMDMAPTILNAMGVNFSSLFKGKVSHSKLGLGRSLYANDETLICKYGKDELIKKLNERSLFYLNLHIR